MPGRCLSARLFCFYLSILLSLAALQITITLLKFYSRMKISASKTIDKGSSISYIMRLGYGQPLMRRMLFKGIGNSAVLKLLEI